MTNPELIEYIRAQIALGVAEGSIKTALLSQGWTEKDVEEGFAAIGKTATTPIPKKQTSPTLVHTKIYSFKGLRNFIFISIILSILFTVVGYFSFFCKFYLTADFCYYEDLEEKKYQDVFEQKEKEREISISSFQLSNPVIMRKNDKLGVEVSFDVTSDIEEGDYEFKLNLHESGYRESTRLSGITYGQSSIEHIIPGKQNLHFTFNDSDMLFKAHRFTSSEGVDSQTRRYDFYVTAYSLEHTELSKTLLIEVPNNLLPDFYKKTTNE